MNNADKTTTIKTTIDGLKGIQKQYELRAEALGVTIECIERVVGHETMPESMKDYMIATMVHRHTKFNIDNMNIFSTMDIQERMFWLAILDSITTK